MKKILFALILIGGVFMAKKIIYVSNYTLNDMNRIMHNAIDTYSDEYHIPKSLIYAIIKTESGNADPLTGPRCEPDLLDRAWAMRVVNENRLNVNDPFIKYSFGVMQVLYLNAVHNGFKGTPFELSNPITNVKYGVMYLSILKKRFKNSKTMFTDIIAAYNQGGNQYYDIDGNKHFDYDKGEKYKNQSYVDKTIMTYRALLKEQGIKSRYDDLFIALLKEANNA